MDAKASKWATDEVEATFMTSRGPVEARVEEEVEGEIWERRREARGDQRKPYPTQPLNTKLLIPL